MRMGIIVVAAAIAAGLVGGADADTGPAPGLFVEQSTLFGEGIIVTRLRDTKEGVVCYVGTIRGYLGDADRKVALSCLPARLPAR
jgi:hypothetical protein